MHIAAFIMESEGKQKLCTPVSSTLAEYSNIQDRNSLIDPTTDRKLFVRAPITPHDLALFTAEACTPVTSWLIRTQSFPFRLALPVNPPIVRAYFMMSHLLPVKIPKNAELVVNSDKPNHSAITLRSVSLPSTPSTSEHSDGASRFVNRDKPFHSTIAFCTICNKYPSQSIHYFSICTSARLQLCEWCIGALAVNMVPVTFSTKLMSVCGGTVQSVEFKSSPQK